MLYKVLYKLVSLLNMEKLRYVPETGKLVPVSIGHGYCTISKDKLEANLDKMAEIIPLLNPSENGGDFEIWIPLAIFSNTGCRIPDDVLNAAMHQIGIIFGGANVVKSVDGLWLNREGEHDYLYNQANYNITIVLQGMNGEDLQQIAKILSESLGAICNQLSMLVVVRPVFSAFYPTATFDVTVEKQ